MTPAGRFKAGAWGAGLAVLLALAGGLATDIGPWYLALRQPPWKPPDALFGPAWTVIYAFTALAGVRAWNATTERSQRTLLLALFALNAVLNVTWSVLFFKLRRPDWSLWEVGILWASIALLALVLGRRRRSCAWLLLPYLVWVAFAARLNAAVVALNGPFGA